MVEQLVQLEGRGRRVQFNLDLDPTETNARWLLLHCVEGRCYEAELAWVMFRTLQEGDVAIDVGANIGFFTLLMSQLVGPTGRIIACEPEPINRAQLGKHVLANKADNVTFYSSPLWCRNEIVDFYFNSDSAGGHALFNPAAWEGNVKSRVTAKVTPMRAITLDSMVGIQSVKLIKIDTEGAEQRILEGASELLRKQHPPYILCELNPHGLQQSGCDTQSLRTYMKQFGYDLFMIHPGDRLPALVPEGSNIEYVEGITIINGLFSTLENVGKAWPQVLG